MHYMYKAYVFMRSCTSLLTYTVGSERIKPAMSLKRLKIELKYTINGLHKIGHGLSIATKMYDLE